MNVSAPLKEVTLPTHAMKKTLHLFGLLIAMSTTAVDPLIGQVHPTIAGQLSTLEGKSYMSLTITGEVGKAYLIVYTTDLSQPITWRLLTFFTLSTDPYLWIDTTSAPAARRFYQAEMSPAVPIANMVFIPPGTFRMGSPGSEAEHASDETQHQVTLTQGFWMGKYETTQEEYLSVMGNNPSFFRNGTESLWGGNGGVVTNELMHPVERVSWSDATNYCGKLTQKEIEMGRIPGAWRYRLPTESEWEYACRAGSTNAFYDGRVLRRGMANFDAGREYDSSRGSIPTTNTYLGRTTIVGSYAANAYGLYDMRGNVYEFCQDWYGMYPRGSVTDPSGPTNASEHLFRGGGWNSIGWSCRSARRLGIGGGGGNVGFRIVLSSH